jgi:hypothetical protein
MYYLTRSNAVRLILRKRGKCKLFEHRRKSTKHLYRNSGCTHKPCHTCSTHITAKVLKELQWASSDLNSFKNRTKTVQHRIINVNLCSFSLVTAQQVFIVQNLYVQHNNMCMHVNLHNCCGACQCSCITSTQNRC